MEWDIEDFQPANPEEKAYQIPIRPGTTFFRDGIRRLRKNKIAFSAFCLIVLVVLGALLLPIFWPYRYDQMLGNTPGKPMDSSYNNLPPFAYSTAEQAKIDAGERVFPHIFGTDASGRDYFIRVVYGARISLTVGFFASMIVLIVGLSIGSVAGYFGGKTDIVIMRLVDIIYSLPDMLMVILLASVLKTALADTFESTIFGALGSNMLSLFLVFAFLYWVSMARLIRGQILSLREQEFVLSARSAGAGALWIIRKHLIPNCIGVVIISTALQIPSAIFTESYLSFLGLGVNAPMPSLGSLASEALGGIHSYPHRLIIPALVISLIVLSLNLFGDGLRDAFDPKLHK